jgi:hypothetical protein
MFDLIFFFGSCKIVKTTNFSIIFLNTKAVRSTTVLGVKVAVASKESVRDIPTRIAVLRRHAKETLADRCAIPMPIIFFLPYAE